MNREEFFIKKKNATPLEKQINLGIRVSNRFLSGWRRSILAVQTGPLSVHYQATFPPDLIRQRPQYSTSKRTILHAASHGEEKSADGMGFPCWKLTKKMFHTGVRWWRLIQFTRCTGKIPTKIGILFFKEFLN